MKAREIAKKIGAPLKDVNVLLYGSNDEFIIDGEYRWSLAGNGAVEFKEAWITAETFETILLDARFSTEGKSAVVFSIGTGCRLMLGALGRLLALCNQLDRNGRSLTIDFNEKSPSYHYFNRIGFFDHLNPGVIVLPGRPADSTAELYKGNSESVVELRRITVPAENTATIDSLTDWFVRLSDKTFDVAAATIFGELIGNVTEHSETKLPAFAGLQLYRGQKRHIQTIVSDSGLGIARTLRPSLESNYKELYAIDKLAGANSDLELVKSTVRTGGISRFGESRGLGFKRSRAFAEKFNASFGVRQERFDLEFSIRGGVIVDVKESTNLVLLEGTHFCFDFFI